MQEYLKLLQLVRDAGQKRGDRTGVGTLSMFGTQSYYNLAENFPAVTCKRLAWKTCFREMLWMLSGSVDVKVLQDQGVKIWDEWQKPDGSIGPGYGQQFRQCDGVDQVQQLIDRLILNPESRRHIINLWNVRLIDEMALPPCHLLSQFYVDASGRLSCMLYQRSADLFLGAPFNIAGYAFFTHLLARHCSLKVGDLIHTIGDAHIYLNHLDQVDEVLSRPHIAQKPKLLFQVGAPKDLFRITIDDVTLVDYSPHSTVAAPVAV